MTSFTRQDIADTLTDQDRQALLDAVTATTAQLKADLENERQRYNTERKRLRQPRRQAVIDALQAGIPRGDIARAAGVQLSRVYQIANGKNIHPK